MVYFIFEELIMLFLFFFFFGDILLIQNAIGHSPGRDMLRGVKAESTTSH